MEYEFKSHPTIYNGVRFRSRHEARWACFFDLANWKWKYEPVDIQGWTPDFFVEFHCGHSECNSSHSLLVEVKPYRSIYEFSGHPCMNYFFGGYPKCDGGHGQIPVDSSAAFGISPEITYWEMAHGAGGGSESLTNWVDGDTDAIWNHAGNIVQWHPKLGIK